MPSIDARVEFLKDGPWNKETTIAYSRSDDDSDADQKSKEGSAPAMDDINPKDEGKVLREIVKAKITPKMANEAARLDAVLKPTGKTIFDFAKIIDKLFSLVSDPRLVTKITELLQSGITIADIEQVTRHFEMRKKYGLDATSEQELLDAVGKEGSPAKLIRSTNAISEIEKLDKMTEEAKSKSEQATKMLAQAEAKLASVKAELESKQNALKKLDSLTQKGLNEKILDQMLLAMANYDAESFLDSILLLKGFVKLKSELEDKVRKLQAEYDELLNKKIALEVYYANEVKDLELLRDLKDHTNLTNDSLKALYGLASKSGPPGDVFRELQKYAIVKGLQKEKSNLEEEIKSLSDNKRSLRQDVSKLQEYLSYAREIAGGVGLLRNIIAIHSPDMSGENKRELAKQYVVELVSELSSVLTEFRINPKTLENQPDRIIWFLMAKQFEPITPQLKKDILDKTDYYVEQLVMIQEYPNLVLESHEKSQQIQELKIELQKRDHTIAEIKANSQNMPLLKEDFGKSLDETIDKMLKGERDYGQAAIEFGIPDRLKRYRDSEVERARVEVFHITERNIFREKCLKTIAEFENGGWPKELGEEIAPDIIHKLKEKAEVNPYVALNKTLTVPCSICRKKHYKSFETDEVKKLLRDDAIEIPFITCIGKRITFDSVVRAYLLDGLVTRR